jgi:phosphate transport system protein
VKHTYRPFDRDLEALRGRVLHLGARVLEQLAEGLKSLLARDAALAASVIAADAALDEAQREIDRLVAEVITRQQAVAQDLREILAAGRIASHLERCADYALTTARRGRELDGPIPPAVVANLSWVRERADRMLRAVLEAYERRDAAQADLAWASDDEIDELYEKLFETILDGMRHAPTFVEDGGRLLLIAKGLERFGDHATDIAEEVHLMVTGSPFRGVRRAIGDAR